MLYRAFLTAAAVAALGVGSAIAQEQAMDPAQVCDAAAAAYEAYSLNSTDPDLKEANHRVTEGVTDCKNGHHDRGLATINHATATLHDHTKTKSK